MRQAFYTHILRIRGDAGSLWLSKIPEIISFFEKKWQIQALPPFTLSYNYVAPVVCHDGTQAVIKIGFPQDKEFATEMSMLALCGGSGLVRLFEYDAEHTAALVELCDPGKSIRVLEETQAITVAAALMKKIWRPVPEHSSFPHIRDWAKAFDRYIHTYPTTGPIPRGLFNKAENIFSEYLSTLSEEVVLHGDLHHDNILSSTRSEWLAIDPKGVIGEKAYEVGIWLRNPYPDLITDVRAQSILSNRVAQFADELSLDKKRIAGWGFAQAILSAIWVAEDREQYLDYYISCAQLIENLRI